MSVLLSLLLSTASAADPVAPPLAQPVFQTCEEATNAARKSGTPFTGRCGNGNARFTDIADPAEATLLMQENSQYFLDCMQYAAPRQPYTATVEVTMTNTASAPHGKRLELINSTHGKELAKGGMPIANDTRCMLAVISTIPFPEPKPGHSSTILWTFTVEHAAESERGNR